jgi:hypothetical protein
VEECLVESADDSAPTCVAERSEGNARLVFPRDGVRDVWRLKRRGNLHIGRWIMVGMGVALVAACGVASGVFGLAVGGAIVVGIKISTLKISSGSGLVRGEDWFMRHHRALRTDAVFGVEELLEVVGEGGG